MVLILGKHHVGSAYRDNMPKSDETPKRGDTSVDYIASVNQTQVASQRIVAENQPDGATRTFGPVTAVSSGLDTSMFNELYVFEKPSETDLTAAIEWMEGRNVPFVVIVADTVLERTRERLLNIGFHHIGSEPGMVLTSLEEVPANETEADIFETTDPQEIEDVAATFSAVFGVPEEISATLFRPYESVAGIESQSLLAEVNGTPAGCGLCILADEIVGVYGIGVREAYRRRGIGEALTWEVLRSGAKSGCRIGMLTSSEMAFPLYRKMGFETVVTHHEFTNPS